jgi:hypothetical protein
VVENGQHEEEEEEEDVETQVPEETKGEFHD